jgi:hypothetical protein
MTKYIIRETYQYELVYTVEANTEEEAVDLILDDPYEYRNPEEDDAEMINRTVEEDKQ